MIGTFTIEVSTVEELVELTKALSSISTDGTVSPGVTSTSPTVNDTGAGISLDREALEKEAKELGVPFRRNIGDESLANKIATFKEENTSNSSVSDDINNALDVEEDDDEDELRAAIEKENAKEPEETEENEEAGEEESEEEEVEEEEEIDLDKEVEDNKSEEETDSLKSNMKKRKKKKKAVNKIKDSNVSDIWS